MTSVAPEFGVFEMHYLVQDRGHAARIADAVVRPILGPIAEKAGYRIIGVWENGYREITNNKKPIVVAAAGRRAENPRRHRQGSRAGYS